MDTISNNFSDKKIIIRLSKSFSMIIIFDEQASRNNWQMLKSLYGYNKEV